jgi:predicted ATP-grasp superfamily ATP-dependent carboligase
LGIRATFFIVAEYGLQLLKAIKWQGVAEVEFLVDERDNRPKLMEINQRFGNPIGLAIASGVNIPGLLYDLIVNGRAEPVYNYKVGTKWRWFSPQDLLWFLNVQNKVHHIKGFLRFIDKDLHYAALSFSDPGPSLGVIMQSLRFIIDKEKRDFIFDRGW